MNYILGKRLKGKRCFTLWESRLRIIDELYGRRANERYFMKFMLGEEIKDN